jgi:hypothetical protein
LGKIIEFVRSPGQKTRRPNLVAHQIDSHRHLHARVRGLELDSKPGVARN